MYTHMLVMCTDHEKGSQDLKAEREKEKVLDTCGIRAEVTS